MPENKVQLYLLLITSTREHKLHSVHTDQAKANQWGACKGHEGEDWAVLAIDDDGVELLKEALEKLETAKTS